MRISVVFIAIALVSLHCSGKSGSVRHIPRDVTITPVNAYTLLNLDSLAVDSFLVREEGDENTIASIKNFYNSRNYQFAWFDEQGLTEQGEAFWNIHMTHENKIHDTTSFNVELHTHMRRLLNGDSIALTQLQLQTIELRLTQHFFKYINVAFKGKVDPEEMQWFIPRRKIDEAAILDSFLTKKSQNWEPLNQWYYKLEGALNTYAKIYQAGGWPSIPVRKRPVKHGSRDTLVSAIKKRLSFTGLYNANDTSSLFTDSLLHAVKRAQTSFGLAATGVVDTVLVKQLNIPVEERMKQMSINLERMRWMPEVPENRLLVNIPEYKLHVVENNTEVMQMNIVVGKTANSTVIFSDMLKYIVFSPYWNIPESIVINEVQPAMRRDANYLSKNNMEITGYSNGLPLIRQKQGRSNALGKVKFIFPNRYNIYLHDTPSKGLFSRQNRAFSHGCIRVSQPFELAKYLLRDDSTWTSQKINEAMNQQAERWVSLAEPMPVFLVYFTAWVNADGMLQFRDDIYGHDQRMKEHLFK